MLQSRQEVTHSTQKTLHGSVCVLISLLAMDFWIRERARNEQKKRWGEKNNTRHNIKVEEMKREK